MIVFKAIRFPKKFRALNVIFGSLLNQGYRLQNCHTSLVSPLLRVKAKSIIERNNRFVDWKRIVVTGGKGGDGCISFMQLFCNEFAGPDGGDGGCGGHVIIEANKSIKSLGNVKTLYKGVNGVSGKGKHLHGANGEHIIIKVPIGTIVKSIDDKEIVDLETKDVQFVAARGGAGGKGNAFYLSNENRHPKVAELGADGESLQYILELRVLAHAGMVGFPNAGKSTLLRAISRARPKVASYPFTTLNPHVGIVHFDDYEQVAIADLPGLIPGAHQNRGLGFAFLRHVKRCICLIYVIDISREDYFEQFESLKYELEQYEPGLSRRPAAIVANKIDLLSSKENLMKFKEKINEFPIFPISAKNGEHVLLLLKYVRKLYDEYNKGKLLW